MEEKRIRKEKQKQRQNLYKDIDYNKKDNVPNYSIYRRTFLSILSYIHFIQKKNIFIFSL